MTDATMTRAKCANTGSTLDGAKVRAGWFNWTCGDCGDTGSVRGMSSKAEDQLADHYIIVHGEDPEFVWEEAGLMAKPGETYGAQRARWEAGRSDG